MSRRSRRRSQAQRSVGTIGDDGTRPILARFDLAQTNANNRNHWANADGLSARASVSPMVRRVIRIRSRYEAENNSWYSGILRTASNHIVGPSGPRLQVITQNIEGNKRVQDAWNTWCVANEFADKLRIMVEAYWRDGESIAMRAIKPRNWPFTLDIRIFETEQCASPWDGSIIGDPFIDDGVAFDESTNDIAFHILKHHPGGLNQGIPEGTWYPASEVLHLYRVERPGMTRGLPRATPSLPMLPIMRRHHFASLNVAESAANWGMYLKSNSQVIDPKRSPGDFAEFEMARNMMTILPAGWEPGVLESKQPGPIFESFQNFTLKCFCRCTNVPYPLAAGTAQDSNFSQFKGDVRNIWKPEVLCEQNRIETAVVERVFRWWLEQAVMVPGLLDGMPPIEQIQHKWHWPPLPDIDPIDTANTGALKISTGQGSLTQLHSESGQDWETEAATAAADFGVDVPTYKAAVFQKTFGLQPGQPITTAATQASQQTPQGEYTQIGQRAFTNNLNRIKKTLSELIRGDIGRVMAEQTLAAIGLQPDRIQALIQDALDGRIDEPQLQSVTAAMTIDQFTGALPTGKMLCAAAAERQQVNFAAAINFKASAGKPRRFEILAYSGGKLPVNGFDLPVIVDLQGLEVPESIPILVDHQNNVASTIGHTDTILVTASQIMLAGPITTEPPEAGVQKTPAQQVVSRSDHKWQASIGALVWPQHVELVAAGKTVEVNGQRQSGPVYVSRKSVFGETSVLAKGADSTTSVNLAAAAANGGATMNFSAWLKSLGVDETKLTPEQLKSYQDAYAAVEKASQAVPVAQPVMAAAAAAVNLQAGGQQQGQQQVTPAFNLQAELATARNQFAAEMSRMMTRGGEIQKLCAGFPEIAAKATAENWDDYRIKFHVLEAQQLRTRPTSFRGAQSAPENMPLVLEAGLCTSLGLKGTDKAYKDEILQAAHTQFRGRMGLQQLIIQAAVASGHYVPAGYRLDGGATHREILMACGLMPSVAGPQSLQAGFTAISLPTILGNVANKEILEGYMAEDNTWQEIAQRKPVQNLLTHTSARLLADTEYEEVGPAGEIRHARFGEEFYTRQAKLFAKMATITLAQQINDDLGAFDDMRRLIGAGSALAIAKLFWTVFMNNSTFFTAGNTNYISGSTTNLGLDGVGLQLGVDAFNKMTTPAIDGAKHLNADGQGVGGKASILLHPTELGGNADLLYTSRNRDNVKASDGNVHAGKYRPVSVWQLSNSNYTGYSSKAWYLCNDPKRLAPMVVSFLFGQETPTVEGADADFGTLGIALRGFHGFGCDKSEPLAALKSKGEA